MLSRARVRFDTVDGVSANQFFGFSTTFESCEVDRTMRLRGDGHAGCDHTAHIGAVLVDDGKCRGCSHIDDDRADTSAGRRQPPPLSHCQVGGVIDADASLLLILDLPQASDTNQFFDRAFQCVGDRSARPMP